MILFTIASFDLNKWQTIILGYKNVFILLAIGFVWHFLPIKVIALLQNIFNKTPLPLKAVLFGLIFWLIYATASAGPQPFIYFQF